MASEYEGLSEEEALLKRAKKRAMYLLGEKAYCSGELLKKLKNNYPDEVCDAVIETMTEYGYIDDEHYAERFAAKLIRVKHFGKRRALYEMKMKGLPEELCENALAEYDDDDIREEILEILRKKYSDKVGGDFQERQKIIAALARRGYQFDDIKECIAEVREEVLSESENSDDEEEWIE